ncbi:DNA replication protein, partial [Enterobacter kobei]
MGNLAKVIPFRPSVTVVERQVADIDDGYTRIANELLEAVMAADLTARQLKVVLAVIRKTYGFGKKFDRITNTQIAAMTGIHHTHVCKAKNEMIAMNIIVTNGLAIGVNKVISDWNFSISQNGKSLAETANETLAKSANTHKPTQLNTKETIQKKERKDPPKSPQGENSLAQEVMDYFNELTGSRC